MIVLDTNVISEILRPHPARSVLDWFARRSSSSLFTTTVTEAEILYGLRLLTEGRRRKELEIAILPIFSEDFRGRVLPFDSEAANVYANIAADRRMLGRPISQFDAQIAAIAISRGAMLATRNIGDFEMLPIEIINPWDVD
ncbi:putative ribonuclease FitB [Agrobacterium sp. DSM 25558]|uniref:type II toxin-antitoxin system VapC family toxin n=1 Tax=Agrobacterium sp. DSM 25558 TaxID=1907665 RepID=UPI0009726259|nr:type II toxin-antitoxin system VapC family toxin [Agrobacterium sp. DSM 25558]SCX13216.1 putative ribonuclease FitB [Agrobacterium sp. DSM 25558]